MKVGVAGFGGVGKEIAMRIVRGDIPGMTVAGVTARDLNRAAANLRDLGSDAPALPLEELVDCSDIICECATAGAFPEIARATLKAGKVLIAVSVAALPTCPDLIHLARAHGGRIRVASGGLPGLDAVRAVREGVIHSVKLKTTFRPESLVDEPFVIGKGFDFSGHSSDPVKVFEGTAGEAATAFPRHFNVGITLSLAGIGFDKTFIEVWIDVNVRGAVHQIEVEAEDACLTLESRNIPSKNPRTSRIVAPSIMATLRSYVEPIQVGT